MALHLAARVSFRTLSRSASFALPARGLHTTPVVLKKKAARATIEEDIDLFDEPVEDLFSSGPEKKASTSATTSTAVPSTQERKGRRLDPNERQKRFTQLVQFTEPRVGRNPTKTSPLLRRTVFPQLIHLAMTAEDMKTISNLMISWKEGNLGTQGKARFDANGRPKGVRPFDEPTSELFTRRCSEFGIPEHALTVFGDSPTYALPLTLSAGRRLLRSLIAGERPFVEVVTAAALYEVHGLPSVQEDFASCALLLGACVKHLGSNPLDKKAKALFAQLVPALEKGLADAEPIPASRDVWEKSLREWLKASMKDINASLQTQGKPRDWLELWMSRSRFFPTPVNV
ncbi:hypothetical protein MIND_01324200 [Mycena indigotica]|uniref:Uncharacterized protein n=1 Tax=Mycena indigotica TaxID=2126181 RepID=A0A8H6S3V8_9AGAR|nr:uncharacterized protein MIND_01324200 [Mycena indigotica]KAF7290830.1 hypothetical protein MIND_01324200 [Mycena indigotica]